MIDVIELFSGTGSQKQSLDNKNILHKVVATSDWHTVAIRAYAKMHHNKALEEIKKNILKKYDKDYIIDKLLPYGLSFDDENLATYNHYKRRDIDQLAELYASLIVSDNLGNISNIDSLPEADLWTYSFPCQDLSLAGKGAGIKEGTKSGLLGEVKRLLKTSTKPKYLLMENVKNLIGKTHFSDFEMWVKDLEDMGYSNYWQVLNAKDHEVPQNRARVFMVSILNDQNGYMFPEKKELTTFLKDILEETVDEKYYLTGLQTKQIKSWKSYQNPLERAKSVDDKYMQTITAKGNTSMNASMLLINEKIGGTPLQQDVCKKVLEKDYIKEGDMFDYTYSNSRLKELSENKKIQLKNSTDNKIAPTITTQIQNYGLVVNSKGNKVYVKEATKKGYTEAKYGDSINLAQPNSKTRRGRVGKQVAQTLTTSPQQYVFSSRIRKLTPRECFRLMGFKDEQFDKLQGFSDNQLYKLAGNSIVVNVLEDIFEELFITKTKPKSLQLKIKGLYNDTSKR